MKHIPCKCGRQDRSMKPLPRTSKGDGRCSDRKWGWKLNKHVPRAPDWRPSFITD